MSLISSFYLVRNGLISRFLMLEITDECMYKHKISSFVNLTNQNATDYYYPKVIPNITS